MSDQDDEAVLRLPGMLEAVDACLGQQLLLPALILIYSGLDAMGWLASEVERGVKESFTEFVDKYVLPGSGLQATALELYAARCAVVHSYTSESKLSQSGHARTVAYAWGTADESKLQESIVLLGHSDMVAVHVDRLRAALGRAMRVFAADVMADPARITRLQARAAKKYGALSTEAVRAFLEIKQRAGGT